MYKENFFRLFEKDILPILPINIRGIMQKIKDEKLAELEEIRLRTGKPLTLIFTENDFFVTFEGFLTQNPAIAYKVTEEDALRLLSLISQNSIYAVEEEIKNGYLTLKGGHRIGLVGKAVVENGKIKTLKHISGFNIRIAREVIGAADKVLPFIIDKDGQILNTLILSPPKAGKTTLLRDLIRQISNGNPKLNLRGFKVGVVDERSEIASCFEGIPQKDVGLRTDVLDACPKALGIMMLLRSMSPEIIATDEIGRPEDVTAIEEAINAGVKLIATAHGKDIEDVKKRPILREIVERGIFDRYVILGFTKGAGTLEKVLDENCELIFNGVLMKRGYLNVV
ncbi:MAG: stage III sporulation protein AA [Thermovenabulum sp.]|uniref:stage III sporulation protein AA n=1 Tax=Thermovenabulum sp. TaxID=3100335 RepID=UPI003C7D7F67